MLAAVVPSSAAAASLTITYTVDGISGANGWYRGSAGGNYIVLHWHVSDPSATTVGCELGLKISGPTAGFTSTCSAQSGPETATKSLTVKIDAEPPVGVTPSLARGADFNGWYNHPVGISWSGSDATSGIASCASVTYGGPDGAGAPVGGGCTDNAGNTASSPVAISYDGTAPVLSKVSMTSGAAADVLRWTSSSASDTAVVQRSARGNKEQPIVFRGTGSSFADKKIQSSLEYTYSVQTSDQAGNASQKISVDALPKVLTLRKLPYVPRASSKPILRGEAKRRASYLPRPAVPRVEAHLRRLAGQERARPARGVEMVGAPLPPRPRAVPVVCLGGPGAPKLCALQGSRQRTVHRPEALGATEQIEQE